MAKLYESLWTTKNGVKPDPSGFWSEAFADVSEEQITRGFQRLLDSGREYPPSLPMFKAMCLQKTSDDYIKEMLEETNKNFRLPKLADKEVGKKYLADIKKKLGVGGVDEGGA